VIDTHYRILKDCLVQDDYDLVQSTYHRLANVRTHACCVVPHIPHRASPQPSGQKFSASAKAGACCAQIEPKMEHELVVDTAAVGAQALEYLKEEHEVPHPTSIHPRSNPASYRPRSPLGLSDLRTGMRRKIQLPHPL
jgi:hypothetical protein